VVQDVIGQITGETRTTGHPLLQHDARMVPRKDSRPLVLPYPPKNLANRWATSRPNLSASSFVIFRCRFSKIP
jgi:hypothetical protein